LAAKLVAGKTEDDKLVRIFGLDVLVKSLEAFELRCEAALGGGINGEDHLRGEQHVSWAVSNGRIELTLPLCWLSG